MCSMSVHYIIQKTLITNKCTKSFFINCKYTLETSRSVYLQLMKKLFVHLLVINVFCLNKISYEAAVEEFFLTTVRC
jgi:hypothetical protein